jgi:hypothetical protein
LIRCVGREPLLVVDDAGAAQEVTKGLNVVRRQHDLAPRCLPIIFLHSRGIACCSAPVSKKPMPKCWNVRQFPPLRLCIDRLRRGAVAADCADKKRGFGELCVLCRLKPCDPIVGRA